MSSPGRCRGSSELNQWRADLRFAALGEPSQPSKFLRCDEKGKEPSLPLLRSGVRFGSLPVGHRSNHSDATCASLDGGTRVPRWRYSRRCEVSGLEPFTLSPDVLYTPEPAAAPAGRNHRSHSPQPPQRRRRPPDRADAIDSAALAAPPGMRSARASLGIERWRGSAAGGEPNTVTPCSGRLGEDSPEPDAVPRPDLDVS